MEKIHCAFQMSDLQMKLGNSLCASWGCLYNSQGNYCQRKTCVSIQNKCLEVIWSLNKLRLSIFSQEFTPRTLHQVLTMWIKTFQNANIKSQTWFWKPYVFTWAHMLLEKSALPASERRQKSTNAENFRILSEQNVVLCASLKIGYLGGRKAEGPESFT